MQKITEDVDKVFFNQGIFIDFFKDIFRAFGSFSEHFLGKSMMCLQKPSI